MNSAQSLFNPMLVRMKNATRTERVAYAIVAATMLLNFAVWLLTPHYLDATILESIEPKPLLHPALNLTLWLSLAVLVIALWGIFDVSVQWLLMALGAGYIAAFTWGLLIEINTWKVHGPRQTVSATVFAIDREKSGRYSKLHVKSTFVDRDGVEKKLWVPMATQLQFTADRRELTVPLCDGWLGTRFVCLNDPLFD
ncbi:MULTISPECIES: hypothetical protein [unclassified Variovorax]|uniref:hypothetical protein n=1 Tax=unclassified Variovorax TaxID=663243 RepID=UPI0025777305|nr:MULTISPECIES: hypothetical protein [unclassified Variovorax]MDM0090568.1 hypothetical protein [Variovorax sp. J22G40]MDM0147767.1 hypothetical protein [Variovorax sp. J2P1-31]